MQHNQHFSTYFTLRQTIKSRVGKQRPTNATIRISHPHLVKKQAFSRPSAIRHFLASSSTQQLAFLCASLRFTKPEILETRFCTLFNRQQTNVGLFPIQTCGPSRLQRLRQDWYHNGQHAEVLPKLPMVSVAHHRCQFRLHCQHKTTSTIMSFLRSSHPFNICAPKPSKCGTHLQTQCMLSLFTSPVFFFFFKKKMARHRDATLTSHQKMMLGNNQKFAHPCVESTHSARLIRLERLCL